MTIPRLVFSGGKPAERRRALLSVLDTLRAGLPVLVAKGVLVESDLEAIDRALALAESFDAGHTSQTFERLAEELAATPLPIETGGELAELCHQYAILHACAGYIVGLAHGQRVKKTR